LARRIESHWIAGPDGRLEAILEEPEGAAPERAALVCHPHPLYGGTMHNKVVHRLARGLRTAGAVVLRFNFRGVGRSEGSHAHGEGELDDAQAALDWLRARYRGLPFVLAGFSFGARVVARLGCAVEPSRVIAAGFPTRGMDLNFLNACPVDKVFIQSTNDEHGPRVELEQLFARFADPKRLIWIPARDHFFDGGLDELEKTVVKLDEEMKPAR
jgi:alpha/beta superfamily hydrolase